MNNPFNKCSAGINDYHLPTNPKFTLTIRDCQCKLTNVIEGHLPLSLICDLEEIDGIDIAKDAWWEVFLNIRDKVNEQDLNNKYESI